ncbi:MAG: asparagine synthase (glutamine-hydrolyzing) [Pseudomonadales bacterium]
MCGILGVIAKAPFMVDRSRMQNGLDSIAHRGPDDSGEFIDGPVWLGHRRLSIIDVEGGHQPMLSEDGAVCLVFNGEIYNFRELKRELVDKGYSFKTNSDTEVLLNLYLQRGIGCTEKLNGIFAFAIWDARSQELHLARDHMGVKPLYYVEGQFGFAFSSEIKALIASNLVQAELNCEVLAEFVVFRDIAGESTLFRGVKRLLPGCTLTLHDQSISSRQFWTLSGSDFGFKGSFDDALSETDRLVRTAVHDQMISDVPLGTFCSGGVDSSLVTAIASEIAHGGLNTYSVSFAESDYDESKFARQVSRQYGTTHHELTVSNDEFAAKLEKLSWNNDEPLNFPNSVHIHAISELAGQDVKVVLTGEGADELFGGYPRYHVPAVRSYWLKIPRVFRQMLVSIGKFSGDHRIAKIERYGRQSESMAILLNSAVANLDEAEGIVGNLGRSVTPVRSMLLEALAGSYGPVEKLGLLDQQTYLLSILNRQDKMSMAASIESRVPFLDTRLVQFANSLPLKFKMGFMENKVILKKLSEKYLPENLIYRRKSGFGVPLPDWFRSDSGLGTMISTLKDDDFISSLFGADLLNRLHLDHREGSADYSDLLWTMLSLSNWAKAFDVPKVNMDLPRGRIQ